MHAHYRALSPLSPQTSNVCFSNCVLQVLYHCVDLRVRLLDYAATRLPYVGAHGTLLHRVCELFVEMAEIEKRNGEGGGGKCSPNAFIACLRKNGPCTRTHRARARPLTPPVACMCVRADLFSAPTQHDAHELLIYVLNELSDEIAKYEPKPSGVDGDGKPLPRAPTFVQELFEGQLVNETECLHCSTVRECVRAARIRHVCVRAHRSRGAASRSSTSACSCDRRRRSARVSRTLVTANACKGIRACACARTTRRSLTRSHETGTTSSAATSATSCATQTAGASRARAREPRALTATRVAGCR